MIGEHLAVPWIEEAQRAPAEGRMGASNAEHPAHPMQDGVTIARLRLDVDRLVAIERIHDRRQRERGGIGAREAAVAVGRPLHRRAHAIAIAQPDVVPHADLVAVVDHRGSRHRQQQAVHQFDTAPVPLQERCKTTPYAQVDARPPIRRVSAPKIVALRIGHHFERELVVVAQEDRPLAVVRYLRRLPQDVGDGEPVLAGQRHVHAGHQREMEGHVAFIALAEIFLGVLRPLVSLGEQHAARKRCVDFGANALQDDMRLGKVLVVRSLALDQVGHGVEPQPIDAHLEPELHHGEDRLEHRRIVEIEVRLVRIEPVPIESLRNRIPRPVGMLGVDENDTGILVSTVSVRPDIEVTSRRAGRGTARLLEPWMLVRRVVDHELGDDPDAPPVGAFDEALEVVQRSIIGMDRPVVADVVAVVAVG